MQIPRIPLAYALALLGCAANTAPPPTPPSPRDGPAPTLTYLGVAGWRLDDGPHTLLVDPYFSRGPVAANTPLVSDPQLVARYAPARADAILVEHSHYDHLLDVPSVAARTGATVIGSESTANVARAAGVAESRLRIVHGGDTFAVGTFSVRVIRGLHSLTGQPNAPIPREVVLPMTADGYTEGGTLQYLVTTEGRSVLFIGSANFIESELEGLHPDVAIVAVGLREKVPDYSCRLMRALGRPGLVFADHFDATGEALGPSQMDIGDEGRVGLARFADEIHACAPATKVVIPEHFHQMPI